MVESLCNSLISIHALRVEGDREIPDVQSAFHVIFLSTPSGWRATAPPALLLNRVRISIHALRVEGDFVCHSVIPLSAISIHALRVEGDTRLRIARVRPSISIHALRVEGDPL